MSVAVDQWVEQIRAGDVRALSRAITAIENVEPEAEALLQQIFPHTGRAYLIGVTGAPGTGKSSLVDRLAAHYRRQGQLVGILAVDPTSPFTGGAILGDRIRMQGHASDPGTFIRSMATRGFLGGLARATADAALVLDAAGKQVILIETVGVGQDEVEIARLADCTLVVLVPGLGDDIQNMKAGLMEIGDIFVLNKSDREGADRFEQQLRAMLELAPAHNRWRAAVVRTVATEDRGIAELAEAIARYRSHGEQTGHRRAMTIERWKQRLLDLLQSRLRDRLVRNHLSAQALTALAEQVAARKKDPYTAVEEILALAGLR